MGAQESRSFYADSNGTKIEQFCFDKCLNRNVTAFVALDCPENYNLGLQFKLQKNIFRN